MSRVLVGVLAACGAATAALVGLAHGDAVPAVAACSGAATGLAAYLAVPGIKKGRCSHAQRVGLSHGLLPT